MSRYFLQINIVRIVARLCIYKSPEKQKNFPELHKKKTVPFGTAFKNLKFEII